MSSFTRVVTEENVEPNGTLKDDFPVMSLSRVFFPYLKRDANGMVYLLTNCNNTRHIYYTTPEFQYKLRVVYFQTPIFNIGSL